MTRMRRFLTALLLLCATGLSACGGPQDYDLITEAFGHVAAVKVYAEAFSAADQEALIKEIRHMEEVMTRQDPQDGEVRYLQREAERYQKASQGAFSPYLGAVYDVWGFNGDDQAVSRKPPEDAAIRAALAKRQLDVRGLVAGYTIDLLGRKLDRMGYKNYWIKIGGLTLAKGQRGTVPWRVDVRHPRFTHRNIGQIKVGKQLAVATRGDYQNYFVYEGEWYSDLLSGLTGKQPRRYQAVTVVANDVMTAEAMANAIFVSNGVIDLSDKRDTALLVVDAKGNHVMTPAFEKLFINNCFENDPC